jgi:hypothetical protein
VPEKSGRPSGVVHPASRGLDDRSTWPRPRAAVWCGGGAVRASYPRRPGSRRWPWARGPASMVLASRRWSGIVTACGQDWR